MARHCNFSSTTSVQMTTSCTTFECTTTKIGYEKLATRSILAEKLGLGKTLTTLFFVLGTSHLARDYQLSDLSNPPVQCAATLIIFTLETLSNWVNEIQIHFRPEAIPYVAFDKRSRRGIKREDLSLSLVVLTTYEMIGPSGNPQHTNQIMIESLDMSCIIQNPNAKKTAYVQKIRSQHMLCLSGTPFQNQLTYVQSLISLLKIWPWNQDWIWRQHLIPRMNVGNRHEVQMLNCMMQIVCLQRTKQAILNLPKKIEKVIIVLMAERWEQFSKDLHNKFIHLFATDNDSEIL
ncbi:hypothetical protein VP01_804g5 [Puccinia sorghi]|uniref:SNF2 N-terminal domain-containing protein n=1 Tax=Puccinia sorghi TaxID=27349 RepID=A0A0L6UB87_9BASI|nr:hypothetical protein VP01_804g5 [Puccinia sorghi]